jgi:hypothetical protein
MRSRVALNPAKTKTHGRVQSVGGSFAVLATVLSISPLVAILLASPAIPAAHAAQPIPVSEYFGNAYNSTQTGAINVTNSTQIVDIRFTAQYGGLAIPRVYVGVDYYLLGAEYNLLVGIQTDSSGNPSGHFLGGFLWNVSSGLCNGCGGWVYPGFAPKALPLNSTINLGAGSVYHLVLKYYNGTFSNAPPLCYGSDCLVIGYIGGTNFQQESLDMHYDPAQALLSCRNIGTCTVVAGANPVYALAFNGSTLWQGQVEGAVGDRGIGATKGGTGLDAFQGERFWMSSDTVVVNRIQVLLSKVGAPTGSLNLIIWNFTAAAASSILGATNPRLILNQTLIPNLAGMPASVDRAFNFSLGKSVVLQTGHLYQMSFVIYGNTTTVGGSNEVGIAVTEASAPSTDLSWGGAEGSAVGPCQRYPGGCAGFRYSGGTTNSAREAFPTDDLIFIMKVAASAVDQPISIAMVKSAPSASVTVNGCYPTPSTFPSDSSTHLVLMLPSCAFTLSFSNSGNVRNGFSISGSFASVSPAQSSCSVGTCSPIALAAYQQLQNTYIARPANPGTWDSGLNIAVSGTQLGVANQLGCSISAVKEGSTVGCTSWFDYDTQVSFASPVSVSGTERWMQSGGNNFTQMAGGNQDAVSYLDQFEVSFAVTPSDAGGTSPSGSGLWETYGPLPIVASPYGTNLFKEWSSNVVGITFQSIGDASTTATVHGSGIITATLSAPVTQPITLTLAEQQGKPAYFTLSGCSVSPATLIGDGAPHPFTSLPSCQLIVTVSSDLPNIRYDFSSEDTPSSATTVMTCQGQTCTEFTATYYEQVSEQFAYTIVGGATPYVKAPVLGFTALGTPTAYTMTGNLATQWLDFGSSWSLVNPLSGSGATVRWFAPSGTSGTATPGGEQITTYLHQDLVTVAATPADCGSTTPSGSNWENAGENFRVTSSAGTGCTFLAWEGTGLITLGQPTEPSTTAFADSNGTLSASFSRNIVPTLPTDTLVLIVGTAAVAVTAFVALLARIRHNRSMTQPG